MWPRQNLIKLEEVGPGTGGTSHFEQKYERALISVCKCKTTSKPKGSRKCETIFYDTQRVVGKSCVTGEILVQDAKVKVQNGSRFGSIVSMDAEIQRYESYRDEIARLTIFTNFIDVSGGALWLTAMNRSTRKAELPSI